MSKVRSNLGVAPSSVTDLLQTLLSVLGYGYEDHLQYMYCTSRVQVRSDSLLGGGLASSIRLGPIEMVIEKGPHP